MAVCVMYETIRVISLPFVSHRAMSIFVGSGVLAPFRLSHVQLQWTLLSELFPLECNNSCRLDTDDVRPSRQSSRSADDVNSRGVRLCCPGRIFCLHLKASKPCAKAKISQQSIDRRCPSDRRHSSGFNVNSASSVTRVGVCAALSC